MALPRGREVLQLLLEVRHGRAEKKKKVALEQQQQQRMTF